MSESGVTHFQLFILKRIAELGASRAANALQREACKGTSTRTVQRQLQELKKRGLVEYRRDAGGWQLSSKGRELINKAQANAPGPKRAIFENAKATR
ncbi:MAG: hypothetical protein KatS3mg038_1026 [Candidatus Kapaibacterium sp.]|nr:MAG: hypothetical protein KatS3mg038_1026 [Candidatus Kapabacteria bacterium]